MPERYRCPCAECDPRKAMLLEPGSPAWDAWERNAREHSRALQRRELEDADEGA